MGGLAAVNVVVAGLGLLSGPLQARALGPDGRGTLAAILVPVTLGPQLASLGLGAYATRAVARGRSIPVVFGSLAVPLLAVSLILVGTSGWIAELVAGGRPLVHRYVQLGLIIAPVGLFGGLLLNIAVGLERWRLLVLGRILSPLIWTLGVVGLYATGRLTVTSAFVVTLAGSLAAVLPFLTMLFSGRPKVDRAVIREGVRFGVKTWLGGLSALAAVRLDQLLMARLVEPAELGLYVVAVTMSTFATSVLVGAVSTVIAPRIAAGDVGMAARASRVTLALITAVAIALLVTTPFLMPLVFGAEFGDAIALAQVLLVASVPFTGAFVLATILVYSGHPGTAARADVAAALLTAVGLVVLLPVLGAMGAAIVSLLAYSVSFALLLVWTSRNLALPARQFLLMTRDDVAIVWQESRSMMRRRSQFTSNSSEAG